MTLIITLNQGEITLQIKKDGDIVAETSWIGDLSLSEKLLSEIDDLLKKSGITKEEVEKAVAVYDDESSVTSARIVQTVADAWNSAYFKA